MPDETNPPTMKCAAHIPGAVLKVETLDGGTEIFGPYGSVSHAGGDSMRIRASYAARGVSLLTVEAIALIYPTTVA